MSYVKEFNKHDDYRTLYENVEVSIIKFLMNCENKSIIEKYENIISSEMKSLAIFTEDNQKRLEELKIEINKDKNNI